MASGLLQAGALATASYNGFVFSSAVCAESVIGDPQQDEAKRTFTGIRWTIVLSDVLFATPPATIDAAIRDACMRLESPAGAFYFVSNAFRTDFKINVPGGKQDLQWGPWPGPVRVEKLGNNYAAKIIWTVTVFIPECTSARMDSGTPIALNYRWMIEKDMAGYSTRRVVGYLQIAQTRQTQATRTFKHTADEYREQLRPATPPGFRPGRDSVVLSAGKERLDFTFEDIQLPTGNIPPPGCVSAKASLKWQNQGKFNERMHIGTLTAEYQMAPGHTAGESLALWQALLQDRIQNMIADMTRVGLWVDNKPRIVPISYSVEEPDIYGPPRASYSLTFMTVTSKAVLLTAGLWKPAPNSDWNLWQKSLADTAFSPRGQAALVFSPADDQIVDACRGDVDATLKRQRPRPMPDTSIRGILPTIGQVTPISSWLDYYCSIQIIEEHKNALHRPIPSSSKLVGNRPLPDAGPQTNKLKTPNFPAQGTPNLNPFGAALSTVPQPSFTPGTATGTPQGTVPQILNTPTYYAVLTGRAMRAAYSIQPPTLVSVGGAPAYPMNDPDQGDGFVSAVVGNCGVGIYAARWQLRYVLLSPPSDAVAPPHPYFAPQGGDSTVNGLTQPGNAQPPSQPPSNNSPFSDL